MKGVSGNGEKVMNVSGSGVILLYIHFCFYYGIFAFCIQNAYKCLNTKTKLVSFLS